MARSRTRVRVTDRDKGWNKLQREIAASPRKFATAGVHGTEDGQRREPGIGNVALMAIHEFGSEKANIPERSVIRKTVDDTAAKQRKLVRRLGDKIYVEGMSVHRALDIGGDWLASEMRRTIDRQPGDWPALKPATIARKGSSRKLVDLRDLLRSIRSKVTVS
jgi:hypothetical protein